MSDAGPRAPFRIRSLIFSVYVPSFLFAVGQGAVYPVVPLFAKELGASVAIAGLMVAMRGIGTMLMDVPGGVFISRFGDKAAMVAGAGLAAIVAAGASLSGSPLQLGVLMLIMGGGWSFWQLARLAYVSEITPVEQRGRVISLLGGVNRFGNFLGPVLGGVFGSLFGLEAAFWLQAVMGVAAAVIMFLAVEERVAREQHGGHGIGGRLLTTISDHRGVFLTTGIPVIALMIMRQGRQIFLPLWGDELELDVALIGLVFGFSFFVDTALFYPAGVVMDRFGRKWTAIPSLVFLALGLTLLPLTGGTVDYVAVAMLTGLGNGLGSGIVMTLGADFSPAVGRAEFLGVWRLLGDVGAGGGPLLISLVTGLTSLGFASVASGGLGLIGAVVMAVFVTETLRRGTAPVSAQRPPPS